MTELSIPDLSLVVLVGASGSGKSTFARTHFLSTEVLSSDTFRGMVANDENDQSATGDAFDVLHYVAGKRLAAGRLTVVDATNVQQAARKSLVEVAQEHDVLPVAIVIDLRFGSPARPRRPRGVPLEGARVRVRRPRLRVGARRPSAVGVGGIPVSGSRPTPVGREPDTGVESGALVRCYP